MLDFLYQLLFESIGIGRVEDVLFSFEEFLQLVFIVRENLRVVLFIPLVNVVLSIEALDECSCTGRWVQS